MLGWWLGRALDGQVGGLRVWGLGFGVKGLGFRVYVKIPYLGILNIMCCIIIRTKGGIMVLTTGHIWSVV